MSKYVEDQKIISNKTLKEFNEHIKGHIIRYGWYLDWLKPFLDKNYRYLDLGCRNGEFLVRLRERTGAWKLYGVELHEESAMIASDRGLAIYTQDVHDLRFESGFFDMVFMTHLLEHTHDPKKVVWQAERVTKPNGKIFIEIPLEPKPDKVPTQWGHWYTFQNPQMLIDITVRASIEERLKIIKQEIDPRKKWFRLLLQKKEE